MSRRAPARLASIPLLLVALLACAARADEITLRSGEVLHGKVSGKVPEGTVIALDGGGYKIIPESEIARISKGGAAAPAPAPAAPRPPTAPPPAPTRSSSRARATPSPRAPATPPAAPPAAPASPAPSWGDGVPTFEEAMRAEQAERERADAARKAKDLRGDLRRWAVRTGPQPPAAPGPAAGEGAAAEVEAPPAEPAAAPRRIFGKTPDYSLEVPAAWVQVIGSGVDRAIEARVRAAIREGGAGAAAAGLDLLAFAPQVPGAESPQAVNVAVGGRITEPIEEEDLQELSERYATLIQKQYPGAADVSISRAALRRVGDATIAHLEAQARFDGGLLRMIQWVIAGKERSFVVTWSAPADEFASVAAIADASLPSFQGAVQPRGIRRLVKRALPWVALGTAIAAPLLLIWFLRMIRK